MNSLIIRELTPELIEDFLAFFDRDAFADNPDWSACYCYWYHFVGPDQEWDDRTGADNRAVMSDLIRRGQAQGLLAYVDGRPVGWCHAAPRPSIPNLKAVPNIERYLTSRRSDTEATPKALAPFQRVVVRKRLL